MTKLGAARSLRPSRLARRSAGSSLPRRQCFESPPRHGPPGPRLSARVSCRPTVVGRTLGDLNLPGRKGVRPRPGPAASSATASACSPIAPISRRCANTSATRSRAPRRKGSASRRAVLLGNVDRHDGGNHRQIQHWSIDDPLVPCRGFRRVTIRTRSDDSLTPV